MADSVRVEGAVCETACFADRRPFCPVTRAPGLLVWLVYAPHPGRPVLRRSARTGRWAGLVRTRGRGGQPDRPAPSHRGCHGGGDRVPAARPPGGRLAWCRGERHCARVWTLHERRHHVARVPDVPSQGLDLVEPVMYLSWTDDVPIVYPPYTCATGNVQDECLTLMGVHVGGATAREIADDLLQAGPPPRDLLCDKGFNGRAFAAAQAARGTAVLVPPAKDQRASAPALLLKVNRPVAQPDRGQLRRDHRADGTDPARRSYLLGPAHQNRSDHRRPHPDARLPRRNVDQPT